MRAVKLLNQKFCLGLPVMLVAVFVFPALGMTASKIQDSATSTIILPKGGGINLPLQLSDADRLLYREIFSLQRKGKWRPADKKISKLKNKILLGHVLYQRYMHPRAYRSKFRELRGWLKLYANQPGSSKIFKLAMRRRPGSAARPRPPRMPKILKRQISRVKHKRKKRVSKPRLPGMTKKARYLHLISIRHAHRGRPRKAENILARRDSKKYLPKSRYDEARMAVALAYFKEGKDIKAFELAAAAAKRSRKYFAQADWIAGLSAFRQQKYEIAAKHFGHVIGAKGGGKWLDTGAAFWTARSLLMAGQPDRVTEFLSLAAAEPRTFYGLIAVELLGGASGIDFSPPDLPATELHQLFSLPAVKRAKALVEVGQFASADAEMRNLNAVAFPEMRQKLMALASSFGLPSTQFKLGMSSARRGLHVDAAAYPIPPWQPQDGFAIDPALVFAFMRQESAFKIDAKSRAGARGLMQLMPSTASFITGDKSLKRGRRNRLFNPRFNITLGQKYLRHLLQQEMVRGDLFRLAVAYNGGPGNLLKWEKTTRHGDDPLLFIESIPSRETRIFIEKVICNYWIYRRRLTGSTPSLEAVAAGKWPTYSHSLPPRVGTAFGKIGK